MYSYIPEDKLNAACQAAADILGISVEEFQRHVFNTKQREYDREDIITWLDEQGYVYTDDDVDQILHTVRDDWDSDRGTWSNIESAYYNNDMHLPYADSEPAEDEDDEDECGCQVTFPQCQKCKHADECEAYQHALKVQAELEASGDQMMMDVFKHDTDNCETFEPAVIPGCEMERHTCDSHCPLHADCPVITERLRKLEEGIDNE